MPSWELVRLILDGSVADRLSLPIPPINEITHLQADRRGDRLLILVRAYVPEPGAKRSMPGRLVLVELGG